MESGRRRLIEVIGEAGKEGWRPNSGMGEQGASASGSGAKVEALAVRSNPGFGDLLNPQTSTPPLATTSALATPRPSSPPPTASLPPRPPTTDPDPLSVLEPHSRTYLILSDVEPRRSSEMTALFGSHHIWGSTKVVPSRSRVLRTPFSLPPLSFADPSLATDRKIPLCPLTGLPAPYRDPLTLTPFATLSAYKTLHRVVGGEYAFHEGVGAFTGRVGEGLERKGKRGEVGGKRENPYAVEYEGGKRRVRKEEGL